MAIEAHGRCLRTPRPTYGCFVGIGVRSRPQFGGMRSAPENGAFPQVFTIFLPRRFFMHWHSGHPVLTPTTPLANPITPLPPRSHISLRYSFFSLSPPPIYPLSRRSDPGHTSRDDMQVKICALIWAVPARCVLSLALLCRYPDTHPNPSKTP